jgi:hypothetical protein
MRLALYQSQKEPTDFAEETNFYTRNAALCLGILAHGLLAWSGRINGSKSRLLHTAQGRVRQPGRVETEDFKQRLDSRATPSGPSYKSASMADTTLLLCGEVTLV